jgi:predicted ABC-type transport system involved in lysophospholipase L1 biosynthesis ATPase subunit
VTPEQQRIAIAQACGWKRQEPDSCFFDDPTESFQEYVGDLPDYCNDLNAMHQAETVMTDRQRTSYLDKLYEVCNPHSMLNDDWNLTCATAAQRAEAFLKTIGKWEEDK